MREYDVFDRIVETYGAPANTSIVSLEKAQSFQNRVPKRLIDFWLCFGWGSWKNGYMWLCDPRPFDPLLKMLFGGDVELRHEDFTLIAYTALNRLKIWDRNGRTILVSLDRSEISVQSFSSTIDHETNRPFSKEFLIGLLLQDELENKASLYDQAAATLGRPSSGEVFGYAPALQLGGDKSIGNLHRVKAVEYMTFIAQLEPMKLVQLSPPRPGFPLGEIEAVRLIGG